MSENIIKAAEYEDIPAVKDLLERHHLETYIDYAGILDKMTKAVEEMLHEQIELKDAVEIQNLNTLADLLPICSNLFTNCDDFYRGYKH